MPTEHRTVYSLRDVKTKTETVTFTTMPVNNPVAIETSYGNRHRQTWAFPTTQTWALPTTSPSPRGTSTGSSTGGSRACPEDVSPAHCASVASEAAEISLGVLEPGRPAPTSPLL